MDPDRLLALSLDQLLTCVQAIQLDRALTVAGLLDALAGAVRGAVPGIPGPRAPRGRGASGPDLEAFFALNKVPIETTDRR